MKLICVAACSMFACVVAGLGAQTTKTTTESKITLEGGKSVKVTGCVAPKLPGPGLMLSNVADKTGALHSYILVSDDPDLAKHIGHRLQISGNVTDRGDAKVTTETKTRTKVENGEDKETRHKSEVQGKDVAGLPYLGVESFKMIAAVCP